MSNNSLENKKDLPDSGKDLPECDFAVMLQGKKILLGKTRESEAGTGNSIL